MTVHIPVPSLPFSSSSSSASSSSFTLASLPPAHPSVRALRELHALYTSTPAFAQCVDVHLALSPFASLASPKTPSALDGAGGRQFNVWRNVARLFARTELVMMLDVDFAVCTEWRREVRAGLRALRAREREERKAGDAGVKARGKAKAKGKAQGKDGQREGEDVAIGRKRDENVKKGSGAPLKLVTLPVMKAGPKKVEVQDEEEDVGAMDAVEVLRRVKAGRAALVIPAFEYVRQEDGLDQRTFPTDKAVRLRNLSFLHWVADTYARRL